MINLIKTGRLAREFGYKLPLQVCKSAAGYYIGTIDTETGPVSRESEEYWSTKEEADKAMQENTFTQRWQP